VVDAVIPPLIRVVFCFADESSRLSTIIVWLCAATDPTALPEAPSSIRQLQMERSASVSHRALKTHVEALTGDSSEVVTATVTHASPSGSAVGLEVHQVISPSRSIVPSRISHTQLSPPTRASKRSTSELAAALVNIAHLSSIDTLPSSYTGTSVPHNATLSSPAAFSGGKCMTAWHTVCATESSIH
jgi:hypothetical protein